MKWFPLDRLPDLESRLAELAAVGTKERRRDALAACLGLHGLRVGEVVALNNGDLWRPTRSLTVRTLKSGRDRSVELDESLIEALDAWQRSAINWRAGDDRPMLPNRRGGRVRRDQFEAFVRDLTREVIGQAMKFHALRHTFAMRLYAATRDLFLVQQSLGHRSVKSTEVYARSLANVPRECLVRLRRDDESPET